MRKRVFGSQLNRSSRARTGTRRSLVRALVENGGIRTSEAKAKVLRQEMDKVFQLVKKDTLSSRRQLLGHLGNDEKSVNKLFSDYKALAESRVSGFTTIKWEDERRGDNSRVAFIELIKIEQKNV